MEFQVRDPEYPQVRKLAGAVLCRAHSAEGKKWSSPDQKPATRCAADTSLSGPRKKLRITR